MSHRAYALAATLCLIAAPLVAQDAGQNPDQEPARDTQSLQDQAEQGQLVLELNNTQDTQNGTCQLTLVAENATGQALDRAAWQVAIFDRDGVVRALPVLDFGALVPGKTRVAVFELPGRPCGEIARIVVNDVAECRVGGESQPDICLGRLSTRARGDIAFGI